MPRDLADSALSYAERGFAVFPLHSITEARVCSCGAPDCRSPGKHPRVPKGVKEASADPDVIKAWWTRWPDANIGMAMGAASGVFAVDVDPRNGGQETIDHLQSEHGKLPDTITASTGGGGWHYLFRFDPGTKLPGKLGNGIDIKGEGGYIVVEPSNHASGGAYAWLAECEPWEMDAATAPDWVLRAAPAPAVPGAPVAGIGHIPEQRCLEIRSALAYLDADDRDTWVRVGMALRESAAPQAFGLWTEWSQLSPKFDGAMQRKTWDTFRPDGRLHVESIFTWASERGWVNPASKRAQEFDDDPDPCEGSWGEAHDPCNHLANAHRLKHHFGDRLLFVNAIGWHVWAPPWRHDEHGARRIGHQLGRIIAAEAAELAPWVARAPGDIERKKRQAVMDRRFKWASASESAPCVESSLKMAEALLSRDAFELDAAPHLLGTPAGVLDLLSGTHREHRQADLITKVCGAPFEPGATAPTWERVVREIFRDDEPLIDYFQRLTGYMLSGQRGEHLLPIFWGSGANGKSTVLGTLQALMGDYSGTAAPDLLITKSGNDHPTSLADLQGRRLVVASETGEAGRLNEERAKLLTGGDTITARRMRMDFYQFRPSHLLVLQTNHRPKVQGTDEGVWRRLRLIPFSHTIPPERRDSRLPEKLRAELPGILQWALAGWRRYQAQGFNDPPAVRAATADYREASDVVGLFLSEVCEEVPVFTETARDLYRAYTEWCEETGERQRTQKEFGMRLAERGFEQSRGGGIRRWRGIRIKPEDEPGHVSGRNEYARARQ